METKNTLTSKTFIAAAILGIWNMFIVPKFPALDGVLSAEKIDMLVNVLGVIAIGVFRNKAVTKTSFVAPVVKK
jgi:hypothetical protein